MIVGLYSPYMQCGKSTVANYLIENKDFTLMKMAGPLKEMLAALLGSVHYNEHEINAILDGKWKEKKVIDDHTGRRLMQTLGTEWGRETLGTDFWVNVFRMKYGKMLEDDQNIVIDDIRFGNEFELVKNFGGFMWQVRPNEEPVGEVTSHRSEGSLEHFPFDVTLINRLGETTLTQLFEKVEKAFAICESQIE